MIYLVLMNLPREERFKPENVIMVGIVPGPKEPKGDINSFFKPLVDELIGFWDGVIFEDSYLPEGMLKLRVALLALCFDVPTTRKCGGFAGYSGAKGMCHKLLWVIYSQSQRYFNQLKGLCHDYMRISF